jgi:hypothetical protein
VNVRSQYYSVAGFVVKDFFSGGDYFFEGAVFSPAISLLDPGRE